ncbi:hypothetical protein BDV41DRAFT_571278 [Aspergillus transmontanensis]|uniref:Uncharacterized protein n=1 Tax=Aspergillus transmontanensis TaxID=1034304 RepID=A0A5N6WDL0_9EURO|nr:hypothetical protein BDV41DRAFT_571278 [Aspergillus transmontanensis]
MGTRGLVFIRCHGRYFVYYNQFDSYPEGLGEAIVQQIPENIEKYHEWLESMRKVFTGLVQKLEEQYIPLDGPTSSLAGRYMKSFLAVDDRLEVLPMQALLPHLWGFDIEYMYTLDLDRELLGVDHSVYFKLSKIPRGGRWHQYLDVDVDENHPRRVLREETPENIVGDVALKPDINSELTARYSSLDIEPISPEVFRGSSDTLLPREALLLSTFLCIHSSFERLLDPFILEWTPESFSFQEIAFALLSIAAGEITFESTRALDNNYEKEGYYILPDGHLLPCFLYERHFPGVEPGSAPQGRTYWFSNILVHLASRLDVVDVEKAAVIEMVDAGLDQGLDEFYAMVFSISDVIFVHVRRGDGRVRVQRSNLMPLFYFDEESSRYSKGPRTRLTQDAQPFTPGTDANSAMQCKMQKGNDTSNSDEASDGDDEVESMTEDIETDVNYTFALMIHFLDMATRLRLADAKSRRVPNEILTSVMHFTDAQTYKSLASVSASCRQLSDRKFRLTDGYDVVGIDTQSMGSSLRFIIEDIHTRERFYPERRYLIGGNLDFLSHRNAPEDILELYVVIGEDTTRRSIINLAALQFLMLPPKDTPCTNEVQMPVPERYYQSFGTPPDTSKLFTIPNYQYLGFIEDAWGKYIQSMIQHETRRSDAAEFVHISGAPYRCLLPPGYRELGMNHYFCNGLQAILRHPQNESDEEWMKTIEYAVHRLSHLEQHPDTVLIVRGRPVIVAFGARVKLFYYIYHREEAPVVPQNASPTSNQFAVSCTDPEPKHRLVQLIPGGEPIDLHHKDDRAKLNQWFKIFCDKEDRDKEWDPITGEYTTMARRTKKVEKSG